jgi:hypothetical protein
MTFQSIRSLTLVLSILMVAPAFAQGTANAGKHPCKEDRAKFCSDQKGPMCLAEHESELSPACKAHVDAMLAKHPCLADRTKVAACKDLKWGQGLGKCLQEHKSELSQACQAKMDQGKEKRQARRKARKAKHSANSANSSAPGASSNR